MPTESVEAALPYTLVANMILLASDTYGEIARLRERNVPLPRCMHRLGKPSHSRGDPCGRPVTGPIRLALAFASKVLYEEGVRITVRPVSWITKTWRDHLRTIKSGCRADCRTRSVVLPIAHSCGPPSPWVAIAITWQASPRFACSTSPLFSAA